jgi:hypothetical protein
LQERTDSPAASDRSLSLGACHETPAHLDAAAHRAVVRLDQGAWVRIPASGARSGSTLEREGLLARWSEGHNTTEIRVEASTRRAWANPMTTLRPEVMTP